MAEQASDAGIARAVLLRAVCERASAKNGQAAADIYDALSGLNDIAAREAWHELIEKGAWLISRAKGGDA